jgi:anti-anti-sigma factor
VSGRPAEPAGDAVGRAEPDELARLTLTEDGGIVRATLAGEVDISNVAAIEADLHALPNHALGLVLDLRATSFIDSSAVSLLYGLRERLRRRGQTLRIVVPPGSAPRRVLELTGYERAGTLDVEPASAEGAIRAAAATPEMAAQRSDAAG